MKGYVDAIVRNKWAVETTNKNLKLNNEHGILNKNSFKHSKRCPTIL